jgi:hypothetical protein
MIDHLYAGSPGAGSAERLMQSLANELFDGSGQNLTLGIRNYLLETGGLAMRHPSRPKRRLVR